MDRETYEACPTLRVLVATTFHGLKKFHEVPLTGAEPEERREARVVRIRAASHRQRCAARASHRAAKRLTRFRFQIKFVHLHRS